MEEEGEGEEVGEVEEEKGRFNAGEAVSPLQDIYHRQ